MYGLSNMLNHIIDLNSCRNDPCHNGTCANTGPDAYKCICKPGYTNTHCESGINIFGIVDNLNLDYK